MYRTPSERDAWRDELRQQQAEANARVATVLDAIRETAEYVLAAEDGDPTPRTVADANSMAAALQAGLDRLKNSITVAAATERARQRDAQFRQGRAA